MGSLNFKTVYFVVFILMLALVQSFANSSLQARPSSRQYKRLCIEDRADRERLEKPLNISCRCPEIRAPVCGSDNVTYHNRCFMHCRATHARNKYHRYNVTIKKWGEC